MQKAERFDDDQMGDVTDTTVSRTADARVCSCNSGRNFRAHFSYGGHVNSRWNEAQAGAQYLKTNLVWCWQHVTFMSFC